MSVISNGTLNGKKSRFTEALPKIIVPAGLLIIWLVISKFELVRPIFIPPPSALWKSFIGMYKASSQSYY